MRLLAVTAGDSQQGRLTGAEEIVGTITLNGTTGFVIFNGVFSGVTFGALYLVVRRFLRAGPLGGVAYGSACWSCSGRCSTFCSACPTRLAALPTSARLDAMWLGRPPSELSPMLHESVPHEAGRPRVRQLAQRVLMVGGG